LVEASAMPLAIRNLSVLAYANGFTLWHYRAPAEGEDEVTQRGYFNDAADMLAAGDMLLLSTRDGGKVVCILSDDTAVAVAPVS
jgi:hypothetical protein